jgi:hypothetical protein
LSRAARVLAAVFAATLVLRLCHSGVLWADEDYHLAAAIQLLHGKALYRDVWYDKPPLAALLYAAIGGFGGWSLRVFDALYVLAISAAGLRLAREMWGETEGLVAASLLGFYLNFDFAFAVVPIAPDLFMILPHLAAVYLAWKQRPLVAGAVAGVALMFNPKGVFVLAACVLFTYRSAPMLLAGFAATTGILAVALAATGSLDGYIDQVWRWGAAYAKNSFVADPFATGFRRTGSWLGFHAVLLAGAFWYWRARDRNRLRIALWTAVSFAGVALGARFSMRYYFLLLPPMVIAASRGLTRLGRTHYRCAVAVVAIGAAIPLARFAPRYLLLGLDTLAGRTHPWTDLTLDQDSRAAARIVRAHARIGDSLLVWGYRPDVFVYTRLPVGSRFMDSQPPTGVPADRHLFSAEAIMPEAAVQHRMELAHARPTFIVDSLSLSNPRLAIDSYPELRDWFRAYRPAGATPLSRIYVRDDR